MLVGLSVCVDVGDGVNVGDGVDVRDGVNVSVIHPAKNKKVIITPTNFCGNLSLLIMQSFRHNWIPSAQRIRD